MVPGIKPSDVVMLIDGGYDSKKIQIKVLFKKIGTFSQLLQGNGRFSFATLRLSLWDFRSEIGVVDSLRQFTL